MPAPCCRMLQTGRCGCAFCPEHGPSEAAVARHKEPKHREVWGDPPGVPNRKHGLALKDA